MGGFRRAMMKCVAPETSEVKAKGDLICTTSASRVTGRDRDFETFW
jgi:hypothetical protein